jgi:hypothetical protein
VAAAGVDGHQVGIDLDPNARVDRVAQDLGELRMLGRLAADELNASAERASVIDHTEPIIGRHRAVVAERSGIRIAVHTFERVSAQVAEGARLDSSRAGRNGLHPSSAGHRPQTGR